MDFLITALGAISTAATSLYALAAYVVTIVAWFLVAQRVQRNQQVLQKLVDLPEPDRIKTLRMEMNAVLPDNITAEDWLRSRKQKYIFLGFTLTCITVLIILGIAFWAPGSISPSINDPSSTEYDQGVNAFNLGQFPDAVAHLSKVASDSPKYREAIALKGNAFLKLGKYADALTDFEIAYNKSRNERERLQAAYDIGLAYLYDENYGKAKEFLVPLLSTTEMKTDPAVIYNAAAVLYQLGDLETARSTFARFPLSMNIPNDTSSRDIFAKAHWLNASLIFKSDKPDCKRVKEEIASALDIAPYLRKAIEDDEKFDACRGAKEKK